MITLEQNSTEHDIYTYFKKLFLKYYSPLCIYTLRYIKDTDVTEDIVQDVFTTMWIKRDEIDFSLSVKPLLYRYAHNKALDYLKSNTFKTDRLDEYTSYASLDSYIRNLITNQTEEDINLNELNAEIQTCIETLPEQCKKVYCLSRVKNMKNKEIADQLGINIKTVEKHISKALSEIRGYLDKKGLLPILAFAILYLKYK